MPLQNIGCQAVNTLMSPQVSALVKDMFNNGPKPEIPEPNQDPQSLQDLASRAYLGSIKTETDIERVAGLICSEDAVRDIPLTVREDLAQLVGSVLSEYFSLSNNNLGAIVKRMFAEMPPSVKMTAERSMAAMGDAEREFAEKSIAERFVNQRDKVRAPIAEMLTVNGALVNKIVDVIAPGMKHPEMQKMRADLEQLAIDTFGTKFMQNPQLTVDDFMQEHGLTQKESRVYSEEKKAKYIYS